MTVQLLPRLEPARAAELRAKVVEARVVPAFDDSLFDSEFHGQRAFPATGGMRIRPEELLELRRLCVDAVSEAGDGPDIDLRLGRVFHDMTERSVGELGNPAVWDFLTLVLLPDVAIARFSIESKDLVSRLTGGNRRHVFQRLWRRWNVLGPTAVESRFFTEDEYQAVLERRVTSEMKSLARGVFEEVRGSSSDVGLTRREYTRSYMKQLVQTTGLVDISESDMEHMSALLAYVTETTRKILTSQ